MKTYHNSPVPHSCEVSSTTYERPKQVIAITAGKGGVGKTNISVNIAASLAASGRKVMLLDADLALANVDVLLGLNSRKNLYHVLSGQCQLNEILVKGPNDIIVIPGASGIYQMNQLNRVHHTGLINAFSNLANELDILIVDTAAGIADNVMSFASAAQEVIVVVCDEPTSLADAYAVIKVMSKHYNTNNFQILANMVKNKSEGRDIYNKLKSVAEKYLDVSLDYLGAIPYDDLLKKAVKEQRSVFECYPSSKSSEAFRDITKRILNWPVTHDNAGKIRFFIENIMHNPV